MNLMLKCLHVFFMRGCSWLFVFLSFQSCCVSGCYPEISGNILETQVKEKLRSGSLGSGFSECKTANQIVNKVVLSVKSYALFLLIALV
jgi:hypothetical protein